MAKRKAGKRGKRGGAPAPSAEDCFAKVWQLTVEKYGAAALAPMRRDIVRIIRKNRGETR